MLDINKVILCVVVDMQNRLNTKWAISQATSIVMLTWLTALKLAWPVVVVKHRVENGMLLTLPTCVKHHHWIADFQLYKYTHHFISKPTLPYRYIIVAPFLSHNSSMSLQCPQIIDTSILWYERLSMHPSVYTTIPLPLISFWSCQCTYPNM